MALPYAGFDDVVPPAVRTVDSAPDADLRVRVHGVRVPLRGARQGLRRGTELSRVRGVGRPEAAVGLRCLRLSGRTAELPRKLRGRLLRRELGLVAPAPARPPQLPVRG